jgi:HD superfamily phosphodiesterase
MQEHERLIDEIKNIVSKYYENNFFSRHDYSHSLRVYNLCKILSEDEEVDMLVLEAAALLHNLGRAWKGVIQALTTLKNL